MFSLFDVLFFWFNKIMKQVRARLPVSNIWSKRLQSNNHPRLLFDKIRYITRNIKVIYTRFLRLRVDFYSRIIFHVLKYTVNTIETMYKGSQAARKRKKLKYFDEGKVDLV